MISVAVIFCTIIGSVFGVYIIIGCARYDMHEARRKHYIQQHSRTKKMRAKPLVTVIVHCTNEAYMHQFIASLNDSTYRTLELIIITHSKGAELRRRIQPTWFKRWVFVSGKHGKKAQRAAYDRYGSGDILLTCTDSQLLAETTLHELISLVNSLPRIGVFMLRCAYISEPTITALLRTFREYAQNSYYKVRSSMALPIPKTGLVAYRRESWTAALTTTYYSDTVLGYDFQEQSFESFLGDLTRHQAWVLRSVTNNLLSTTSSTLYAISIVLFRLCAIVLVMLLIYAAYLAFGFHQPLFLVGVLLLMSCIAAYAVWSSRGTLIKTKIVHTVLIPALLPLFYLYSGYAIITMLSGIIYALLQKPHLQAD